jgi:hypothetical protein
MKLGRTGHLDIRRFGNRLVVTKESINKYLNNLPRADCRAGQRDRAREQREQRKRARIRV